MFWTATAGLLALVTGIAADAPTLTLLALVASTAAVLHRRLAADVALPAAAAALLLVSTAAGLVAEYSGTDLLAVPAAVRAVQLAWAVACVAVCARPGLRKAPSLVAGGSRRAALLTVLTGAPACIAAAVGLAQLVRTDLARSWAAVGTDVANHLVLLQGVHDAGGFVYASHEYPRGLHLLLALADPAARSVGGPELLARHLTTFAATTWFTTALLLWTAGALVRRVALALGATETAAAAGASIAGAGLLATNSFVLALVIMGGTPALLAVVVLWTPPLWLLSAGDRVPPHHVLWVLTAGTVLVAHLWQALVCAGLLAAVALLLMARRQLLRGLAGSVGTCVRSVAVLLVALAAASPALLGVVRQSGLGTAAIPGDIAPTPLSLLLVAAAALVAVRRCRGRLWLVVSAGTATGLVVTVGTLLAASGSLDVTQWYPMKALWLLVLFLGPFGAGVLAWRAGPAIRALWAGLGRWDARVRLTRFTVLAVTAAAAVSFVLPPVLLYRPTAAVAVSVAPSRGSTTASAGPGAGAAVDAPPTGGTEGTWVIPRYPAAEISGRRVEIAEQHATSHAPAVAVPVAVGYDPVFDARASGVVSALMTVQTGQPYTTGDPRHVCEDVRTAAGDRAAVVVTALPVDDLRRLMVRRGCGDVPIVQVPGGSTSVPFELDP